ncbi:MAG: flagellar motor switch protein FliN [Huintestinicola sp.]|uniref:flagellar motor switch protein FliN n=1 Tax=Huintestinicola sp. TaxID=2981661 RepID=UPI003F10F091
MSDENVIIDGFGEAEQDAIGEIMNITMGSAATAVSNMLSAKVWITTPTVTIEKAKDMIYPELEPSIHVKIKYIQGVSGENVLVLKQDDVQLILNQLMGLPLEVTDDFEFDEMNISAVCEVMNQMMGASATALSELINTPIDISTPQAEVSRESSGVNPYGIPPDDNVCAIRFKLTIDNVINSEFISVMTIDLAKEMAQKMMAAYSGGAEEPAPAEEPSSNLSQDEIQALLNGAGSGGAASEPAPAPAASSGGTLSQEEINALLNGGAPSQPAPQPIPQPAPQPMAQPAPDMSYNAQQPQQAMGMQGVPPQMGMAQQAMPQQGMPMAGAMPYGGYYGMPPYGYPPMQPVQKGSAVNVQAVQLQSFENYNNKDLSADQNDNLKLLMGVPLNVTVEIGSARKKVKEILDFTQGTIIELERQAGSPVDIIVNGHLIAKGDVVVIDDNFAVRITEIIKSKFLDNLGKE